MIATQSLKTAHHRSFSGTFQPSLGEENTPFLTVYSIITHFEAFEIHIFENIMKNLEQMLHFPQYFQMYSKSNLFFS